jgi:hypothetical protein
MPDMDYSNTVIYKLYSTDHTIKDCYISHTTNYANRKYHHTYCCNNNNNNSGYDYNLKAYEFIRKNGGIKNWTYQVLEYANLTSNKEAVELVGKYYYLLNPSLNTPPHIYKTTQEKLDERRAYLETYNKNNPKFDKYKCECGKTTSMDDYKRHQKCNIHRAYVMAKLTPDEMVEHDKHHPPREVIHCCCGGKTTKYNMNKHIKTIRHKQYIANEAKATHIG